jgi:hypothetical protein
MSVRTQPGATSRSARGSPAWRAERHFISMLSAALLEETVQKVGVLWGRPVVVAGSSG